MKMKKCFVLAAMLIGLSLSACNQSNPKITGYSIDENNNVVVIYDNGNQETVGNLTDEDIGNHVTSVTISQDGYYVINGIKTDIKATEVYTVKFNTGYSAIVPNQKILEGHKVKRPQLDRTGYELNGWFCNGEEWRFNSDIVLNDMALFAQWTAKQYTISFINEKGPNPSDLSVTYDSNYTLPTVDAVDGYTFDGWYNGNTKYSGGIWTTDSNITLTAKWTANTYTVTLNPGVGSVSKTTQTVTYGQNYTLPVPTNSYGVFAGWLCDGEAVTDSTGHSLAPWTYLEDKTFTVDWAIKIYNKADLLKMNQHLNAEFELMNDIVLTGSEWIPIGTKTSPFTGKLNGNGYSIVGLTITNCYGYSGLFGCLKEADISNIGFSQTNIAIPTADKDSYVGTVCGYGESAVFCDIEINGNITSANHSSDYLGLTAGVCGYAKTSAFVQVFNNANVEGYYSVGGIISISDESLISESVNTGDVTSVYDTAGGIIAKVNTSISDNDTYNYSKLSNRGNITSAFHPGGVIGKCTKDSLIEFAFEECSNYGDITSTNNEGNSNAAGGIMGKAFYLKFTNCYNRGNVSSYSAGGIAGNAGISGEFKNCYSSGNISGKMYVGGMGGWINQSATKESVTFGTISSTSSFSVNTCGTDKVNTPTVLNVYYNCSASTYIGTSTSERYSSTFYTNILFWNSNIWSFSETTYPTLAWEK